MHVHYFQLIAHINSFIAITARIVMISKQLGQQLETAAIQEVDSLKRRLDHECQQNTNMKQQISYLSTENYEVKTKNLILETTSLNKARKMMNYFLN